MGNLELYAIYSLIVNVANGMDLETAKGDALYLANVMNTRANKGWSGKRKTAGAQTIPSKVFVKDGVTKSYKVFGGKVMNGSAFDSDVIRSLGEEKYKRLLSLARQEMRRGKSFSKVIESMRSFS